MAKPKIERPKLANAEDEVRLVAKEERTAERHEFRAPVAEQFAAAAPPPVATRMVTTGDVATADAGKGVR